MNLLPSKHLECEKSLRLQPADYPSGTVQRVLHSKSECTGAIPTVASSGMKAWQNGGVHVRREREGADETSDAVSDARASDWLCEGFTARWPRPDASRKTPPHNNRTYLRTNTHPHNAKTHKTDKKSPTTEHSRQEAESRKQKAESRKQKAESRKQKAESRKQQPTAPAPCAAAPDYYSSASA